MKNQYVGDIYDYIKYGLLRQLSVYGTLSTAVCWMLTENDDGRAGQRVNYLHEPAAWRAFDPPVFDFLRTAVLDSKTRNIKTVEESGLLANTTFYSLLLRDGFDERQGYFDGFLEFSNGKDLAFFDPDNGLEVKSVQYGRKGASRYLFLSEVSQSFSAGHSVVVYQHMPPKPRDPFIDDLASRLLRETKAGSAYVFHTRRIAISLVPQTDQMPRFAEIASRVQANWAGLLSIRRYMAKNGIITTQALPTTVG